LAHSIILAVDEPWNLISMAETSIECGTYPRASAMSSCAVIKNWCSAALLRLRELQQRRLEAENHLTSDSW